MGDFGSKDILEFFDGRLISWNDLKNEYGEPLFERANSIYERVAVK